MLIGASKIDSYGTQGCENTFFGLLLLTSKNGCFRFRDQTHRLVQRPTPRALALVSHALHAPIACTRRLVSFRSRGCNARLYSRDACRVHSRDACRVHDTHRDSTVQAVTQARALAVLCVDVHDTRRDCTGACPRCALRAQAQRCRSGTPLLMCIENWPSGPIYDCA